MCGRFTLRTNPRDFADIFSVVRQYEAEWQPAYNIAPTQSVVCIRDRDEREFFQAKWGLIPSWAKDAKIGSSCINARVETVDAKPRFSLCLQEASLPGHGRWFLRMAQDGQAAALHQPQIGRSRWPSRACGRRGSLQKASWRAARSAPPTRMT